MRRLMLLSALLLTANPTTAQTVTDGDTIKMAGTTYRLHGIDAPETHQTCADGWPAGRIATEYLVNLMHGHTVTCTPETKDRYGRTVALCRADGVDVEAEMVRNGMALAFVRYSRDYVLLEDQARADGGLGCMGISVRSLGTGGRGNAPTSDSAVRSGRRRGQVNSTAR
jgi:endonuclease YncB( thermonuclease family)